MLAILFEIPNNFWALFGDFAVTAALLSLSMMQLYWPPGPTYRQEASSCAFYDLGRTLTVNWLINQQQPSPVDAICRPYAYLYQYKPAFDHGSLDDTTPQPSFLCPLMDLYKNKTIVSRRLPALSTTRGSLLVGARTLRM